MSRWSITGSSTGSWLHMEKVSTSWPTPTPVGRVKRSTQRPRRYAIRGPTSTTSTSPKWPKYGVAALSWLPGSSISQRTPWPAPRSSMSSQAGCPIPGRVAGQCWRPSTRGTRARARWRPLRSVRLTWRSGLRGQASFRHALRVRGTSREEGLGHAGPKCAEGAFFCRLLGRGVPSAAPPSAGWHRRDLPRKLRCDRPKRVHRRGRPGLPTAWYQETTLRRRTR